MPPVGALALHTVLGIVCAASRKSLPLGSTVRITLVPRPPVQVWVEIIVVGAARLIRSTFVPVVSSEEVLSAILSPFWMGLFAGVGAWVAPVPTCRSTVAFVVTLYAPAGVITESTGNVVGVPPGGVITTARSTSGGLPDADVVMKTSPSGCEQFSEEMVKSLGAARTRKTARPERLTTSSRAMAADRRFFMALVTLLALFADAMGL